MLKKLLLFLFLFTQIFANNNSTYIHLTTEEKSFIKNNPIINVGAETDWPPFDFVENGNYTGYAKDTLDLIEKKSGLKFNYITDTWKNLLSRIKNKEIDMLPCLAKSAQREKFLLFTEAYVTTRDYLFAKDDNNTINTITDINGKTAAVVRGYVQEETFKKDYPEVKLYYAKNLLDAMDAVITNKADFIVSNIALMSYYTKKFSVSTLQPKFHFGFNWDRLHMATRDDQPILRNIIQKSIDGISKSEKNEIISRWILNKELKEKKVSELDLSNEEQEYVKNKKEIIIANGLDWVPFDYYENNTSKGYIIDYVKLIAQKLSLKPTFITKEWTELVSKFKNGEIDVLPVISYNPKREKFLKFTKPYMSQILSIVTRYSRTDIINIDDLNNKKVGMVKGWNLTTILRENYPSINIIEFESLKDIFDAISDNFIDATIQNDLLLNYYINKNYKNSLKIVTHTSVKGFKDSLYMGIKKDSEILYNLFNKAILSITKEELKILDDKWINISKSINFTEKERIFIKNTKIKGTSTKSWAPFNYLDNDNNMKGISIDFWNYIVNKANIKTEFLPNENFVESVNSIKNKSNDIIFGTSETKERNNYAIFSETYFKSPLGIATLQDKNFIKNASELLGKKIAVGRNFSAHRLLQEKYPNMDFVFVKSVKEGLEYLSDNKAYAYIDIMPVLTYNIKNLGFTNIKITGQTGIEFNLKFMIRDDYVNLQSIVNKVLKQMTYIEKEKIFNKWLKTKFEEKPDYSLLLKIVLVFIVILLFVVYKNRQLLQYQKKLELAKNETEKSLNNFKTLIELNVAGILIIRDKKIVYLNDEAANILEYSSKNELINIEVSEIIKVEKLSNLCDILSSSDSYEMSALSKTNKIIPVLLKGKEVEFDNLPSHIISLVDLTDIKNKEELMLQQSKMASLGEMIGNIAHQWRQPLSSISTTSSGLKLQKEFNQLSDKDLNESLDNITETTKFLSETINDFQNYIKEDKLQKKFNILNSIEKVLTLMKGSFVNSFITVENDLEEIIVNSYENELNQALLNILSNAKDALKNIDEKDRYIYISSHKTNKYAVIEIIDNGGGIDKSIIKKVFEPYFTTKHKSQGTGLGLYMTHKILTDSMKGSISIDNCRFRQYKKCTKITLKIPL
jgi:ABC-type amino acid transport substrate-binding protein/signal transduction histidine kinase